MKLEEFLETLKSNRDLDVVYSGNQHYLYIHSSEKLKDNIKKLRDYVGIHQFEIDVKLLDDFVNNYEEGQGVSNYYIEKLKSEVEKINNFVDRDIRFLKYLISSSNKE